MFEKEHAALPSRWMIPPVVERLKTRARELVGLSIPAAPINLLYMIASSKDLSEDRTSSRPLTPPLLYCLQGLWNLFMMEEHVYHSGLTMVEYAVMSEVHGH